MYSLTELEVRFPYLLVDEDLWHSFHLTVLTISVVNNLHLVLHVIQFVNNYVTLGKSCQVYLSLTVMKLTFYYFYYQHVFQSSLNLKLISHSYIRALQMAMLQIQ